MPATVTPLLTQVYTADSSTDWGGSSTPTADTEQKVQGVASLSGVTRNGTRQWYKTLGSPINIENSHIYTWFMSGVPAYLATKAQGGWRIHVRDGSGNWGEWYVGGSDEYSGGWKSYVQDTSITFHNKSTTAPDLTAITHAGMGCYVPTLVANKTNTWWDVMYFGEGLRVTGGTSGSPGNFEDVYNADSDPDYMYGVIQKMSGVYIVKGKIVFGSTSAGVDTYFDDSGRLIVFEDANVASDLYEMRIDANATGTTDITLGQVIQAGDEYLAINPIVVKAPAGFSYLCDFSNTNIDALKLYSFLTQRASDVLLGDSGKQITGTVHLVDCSFEVINRLHRNFSGASLVARRNKVPFATSTNYAMKIFDSHGYDNDEWQVIGGYGLSSNQSEIDVVGFRSLESDQDVEISTSAQIWNFINPVWDVTSGSPKVDWTQSTGDIYEKYSHDYLIQTPAGVPIEDALFLVHEASQDELVNVVTTGSDGLVSENIVKEYWYDITGSESYGPFVERIWTYAKNPFEAAIPVSAPVDSTIALTVDTGVELTLTQAQAVTDIVVTSGSHGAQGKVWYYQIDCGGNDLDDVYSWLSWQYTTSGSSPWLQDMYSERVRLLQRAGNTFYTEAIDGHGVYLKNYGAGDVSYMTADDDSKYYPPVSVDFTLTGLIAGTEVGIYRDSDQAELYHVESSGTSITYPYVWSGDVDVYVQIHHVQYESMTLNDIVLGSTDQSIPISQEYDRNYNNP